MGIFLSAAACNKSNSNAVEATPAQTFFNVAYGKDSAQKMDIYLPANRTTDSTIVILLIHGGAWMEGDKSDFSGYISLLKNRLPDYAIVNVNYRLATQGSNYFPTQEVDVAAAVSFINDKKADYQVSNKLVLLGASAGGHLALLHAYKHTIPVPVQAVVSFFGPADLLELYNNQSNSYYKMAFQTLIGGSPQSNLTAYQQSSPTHFVNEKSCPTLLLQGGKDMLVAPDQSTALKNKLLSFGVPAEMILYPTEGHGWGGANLDDSFDKIKTFLQANVH